MLLCPQSVSFVMQDDFSSNKRKMNKILIFINSLVTNTIIAIKKALKRNSTQNLHPTYHSVTVGRVLVDDCVISDGVIIDGVISDGEIDILELLRTAFPDFIGESGQIYN